MATLNNPSLAPATEATSLSVTPAAGAMLSGTGSTSGNPNGKLCKGLNHKQRHLNQCTELNNTAGLLPAGTCQTLKRRHLWPDVFHTIDCQATWLDNVLNVASGAWHSCITGPQQRISQSCDCHSLVCPACRPSHLQHRTAAATAWQTGPATCMTGAIRLRPRMRSVIRAAWPARVYPENVSSGRLTKVRAREVGCYEFGCLCWPSSMSIGVEPSPDPADVPCASAARTAVQLCTFAEGATVTWQAGIIEGRDPPPEP